MQIVKINKKEFENAVKHNEAAIDNYKLKMDAVINYDLRVVKFSEFCPAFWIPVEFPEPEQKTIDVEVWDCEIDEDELTTDQFEIEWM